MHIIQTLYWYIHAGLCISLWGEPCELADDLPGQPTKAFAEAGLEDHRFAAEENSLLTAGSLDQNHKNHVFQTCKATLCLVFEDVLDCFEHALCPYRRIHFGFDNHQRRMCGTKASAEEAQVSLQSNQWWSYSAVSSHLVI